MPITPTIGRVVLYWPERNRFGERPAQPWPALVAFVHEDGHINVGGFKANGDTFSDTHVVLLQDDAPQPDDTAYAEWMPYQKKVAAEQAASPPQGGPAPQGWFPNPMGAVPAAEVGYVAPDADGQTASEPPADDAGQEGGKTD